MNKILTIIALLTLLAACKPSEKNYRLAYETALARDREGLDEGVYELMQQEALPPLTVIMGDSVRVMRKPLKWYYSPAKVDSGKQCMPEPYNLAVSRYKMPTNARAHADALADEGYPSCVFLSGSDQYYVIAQRLPSLDSAARASAEFLKSHKEGYVGISCPIALQPMY